MTVLRISTFAKSKKHHDASTFEYLTKKKNGGVSATPPIIRRIRVEVRQTSIEMSADCAIIAAVLELRELSSDVHAVRLFPVSAQFRRFL